MYSNWTSEHASLSDSVLSEKPPSPPAEGTYSDYSFGNWLDDETFEPDWDEDEAADVARALRTATLLLTRQADACAVHGLLPDAYYGEDCDFEEFFTPEVALQAALRSPEWGCLYDIEGQPLAGHLADAVDATVAELRRLFDHQLQISARLRFRLMKACRAELTLLHSELHASMNEVV